MSVGEQGIPAPHTSSAKGQRVAARGTSGAQRSAGTSYPTLRCSLCPHACEIGHGEAGDCRVRINFKGKLYAVTYGRPCAVSLDPIEKKPLFHFLPATKILSIATAGCNLHCKNCQNAAISQADPEDVRIRSWPEGSLGIKPKDLVRIAKGRGIPSIAYTYTEPVVYFEYAYETAALAREAGVKNVSVTAGYINEGPLRKLCRVVDAANVDLKTMNPRFFRENCGGELRHVLRGLEIAREEGLWLEVTNLLLPGLNDSTRETESLCRWVVKNLGEDTPLHFSRFYPHHQLRNLAPTPVKTLVTARKIARDKGLRYVYIGNVRGEKFENTLCPSCGAEVLQRVGYTVTAQHMKKGRCARCGEKIAGIWK